MSETTENNTTNILDHGDVEEDDSLDNFFKKKDKKGKKKKSKKSEAGFLFDLFVFVSLQYFSWSSIMLLVSQNCFIVRQDQDES